MKSFVGEPEMFRKDESPIEPATSLNLIRGP
jgi:hypothetical protein